MESPEHGIAAVLKDMSIETLVTEYWARKPLFLKGTPADVDGLFSRERFWRAIEAGEVAGPEERGRFSVRASFDRGQARRDGSSTTFPVAPGQQRVLFAGGATICVDSVERFDARLARFARRVKASLGYPGVVRCNAYYSPEGAGFGNHFDARIATTLQIHGKKTWLHAPDSPLVWPKNQASYPNIAKGGGTLEPWEQVEPAPLSAFREVTLEVGDVLMLPAGTWHAAAAQGGESLAINLAFEPFDALAFITGLLKTRLEPRARWRGLPPAHQRPEAPAEHPVLPLIPELLEELQQLAAQPYEIWKTWATLSAAGDAPSGPEAAASAPPALEPSTRLRVVQHDPPVVVRGGRRPGTGGLFLAVPADPASAGNSVDIDDPASAAFVDACLGRRELVVAEAASWPEAAALSAEDVRSLLDDLVAFRVLEVVVS